MMGDEEAGVKGEERWVISGGWWPSDEVAMLVVVVWGTIELV